MKTKKNARPGILAIGFDEKSVFTTILGLNPHWAYKHYVEDISQKIKTLVQKMKLF